MEGGGLWKRKEGEDEESMLEHEERGRADVDKSLGSLSNVRVDEEDVI